MRWAEEHHEVSQRVAILQYDLESALEESEMLRQGSVEGEGEAEIWRKKWKEVKQTLRTKIYQLGLSTTKVASLTVELGNKKEKMKEKDALVDKLHKRNRRVIRELEEGNAAMEEHYILIDELMQDKHQLLEIIRNGTEENARWGEHCRLLEGELATPRMQAAAMPAYVASSNFPPFNLVPNFACNNLFMNNLFLNDMALIRQPIGTWSNMF